MLAVRVSRIAKCVQGDGGESERKTERERGGAGGEGARGREVKGHWQRRSVLWHTHLNSYPSQRKKYPASLPCSAYSTKAISLFAELLNLFCWANGPRSCSSLVVPCSLHWLASPWASPWASPQSGHAVPCGPRVTVKLYRFKPPAGVLRPTLALSAH